MILLIVPCSGPFGGPEEVKNEYESLKDVIFLVSRLFIFGQKSKQMVQMGPKGDEK